ncbi:gamma-glutamyltransferase [Salinigranum marinum]|uniref:gamma-glutamyltransferase n=1 Tax=Salinigranum marinum TaxID=1515595 RepID=UPI002989CD7D|nr:gamma-glutamyltransferase [Salinigranum marinum]
MVSSPHTLASAAGLDVLQRGGSAVDAAIATNAVLCVAYPHMAGLGGDGFWLVHDGRGARAVNASGPAAAEATPEYYADRGYDAIPERGAEAALTVPGAVDGWRAVHEAYGRLEWGDLFQAAIRYARDGVPVARSLADWLVTDRDLLRGTSGGETFLRDGAAPEQGSHLVQRELAATFERLANDGPRDGFYEGTVAEEFCASLDGSPLRASDFAAYRAEWVDPVTTTYRGKTVHELPPNTQGFSALSVLNLLEGFDPTAWGDGSADYYHHLTECVKLAFADRDAWLTDPDFFDIPVGRLIDKEYAAERRARIDAERVLPSSVDPGIEPPTGAASRSPGGDTVYFTAVDDDGLVVSAIQSIYFDFGSGVVAGDTGIVPQNRGAFFSLDDTHPNVLEPGKRSFHTLIPALVTVDGTPRLAFGTMGGEGQPQTQAALLTRLIDFEYDVQQALEAPRWLYGRTWGADTRALSLEGRVSDRVASELERRGHPVRIHSDWDDTMGHAAAIRVHENGLLEGGADPRGDGAALGY